jgi:acyl-homoserine lactone acylase PvdQ
VARADVDRRVAGLKNPKSGWLYNSNNWPWSAAGPDSLKRDAFPSYVDRGTEESPRGKHALKVFPGKTDFTLDSLLAAAYDSYLPYFRRGDSAAGEGVGRGAGG